MKRMGVLVLILCACLLSAAWAQQPASRGDWTEFHFTNMERWNPYEHVLNVNNVGNLQLKWSRFLNAWYASPTVANGVAYIVSCCSGQHVYALNARNGHKLWSHRSGDGTYSPAVAAGVVYLGPTDGNVYALNAKTGAKLWSYATGNLVPSSPAVANGVVYVGSYDNNVYAFDQQGGELARTMQQRPDPKTLQPDFNLKPSQPVTKLPGNDSD